MPASIEGGRWDTWLRRFFSLKTDSISPEVSDFVQPTIQIPQGAEAAFLLRDKLVMGRAATAGVAAQFSRIVLENPVDSGSICVVEKIYIDSAGSNVNIHLHQNLTAGVGAGGFSSVLDTRWGAPLTVPTVGALFVGNVVAALGSVPWRITTGTNIVFNLPMILWSELNSTSSLVVEAESVNTSLSANIYWREIRVEPSWNG